MSHYCGSSKLAVERKGNSVFLKVVCPAEYDAMMLYDKATEMLKHGYIRLEFAAPGSEHLIEREPGAS